MANSDGYNVEKYKHVLKQFEVSYFSGSLFRIVY